MFLLRLAITIANIFMILVFLTQSNIEDRNSAIGALAIELIFVFNTILIWS